MRFLVRWAFRFCILFVVALVALVLLKDVLAKAFLEHQIRARSGLDVNISGLELGLFSPRLTVQGMKLFNRAEFGGSPFLDVPDLHLEYDAGALVRGRLHLALVRLVVTEINVVEARDGRTNLVLALAGLGSGAPAPKAEFGGFWGLRFGGIDTLNLTLGKVRYTSLKHPADTTEVALQVRNQIYTGIRSVPDLQEVLTRSLFRNGFTITTRTGAEGRRSGGARKPAVR